MAIAFNKADKVVEVSSVTSVTIQEIINASRDYEDSEEGMTTDVVANAYGKQGLGAGMAVGITLELINNWRIQFEEETVWTTKYVLGGNLVAINDYGDDPIKPSAYVNVIISGSTSPSIVYAEGGESVWSVSEKDALINTVEFIKQFSSGKWKIAGNQMIFYKDDNQTELMRFNLFDQYGIPAMTKVFERSRV